MRGRHPPSPACCVGGLLHASLARSRSIRAPRRTWPGLCATLPNIMEDDASLSVHLWAQADPRNVVGKHVGGSEPVAAAMLDPRGAFVLHSPTHTFVWLGRLAPETLSEAARQLADQLVRYERAAPPQVRTPLLTPSPFSSNAGRSRFRTVVSRVAVRVPYARGWAERQRMNGGIVLDSGAWRTSRSSCRANALLLWRCDCQIVGRPFARAGSRWVRGDVDVAGFKHDGFGSSRHLHETGWGCIARWCSRAKSLRRSCARWRGTRLTWHSRPTPATTRTSTCWPSPQRPPSSALSLAPPSPRRARVRPEPVPLSLKEPRPDGWCAGSGAQEGSEGHVGHLEP